MCAAVTCGTPLVTTMYGLLEVSPVITSATGLPADSASVRGNVDAALFQIAEH